MTLAQVPATTHSPDNEKTTPDPLLEDVGASAELAQQRVGVISELGARQPPLK